MMDRLEAKFRRIAERHQQAIVSRSAKMILGGAVLRVFMPDTAKDLRPVLEGLPLDALPGLRDEEAFEGWFLEALDKVADAILLRNPDTGKSRVHPGYKWGHGTKVLTLFLREVVVNSRYFSDADAARIEHWLYVPMDRVCMEHLRKLGCALEPSAIKDIREKDFWEIQKALGEAARKVGVPRIWFDDVWAEQ